MEKLDFYFLFKPFVLTGHVSAESWSWKLFQTVLQEIRNSLLSFRFFGSILVNFVACLGYTFGIHSSAKNFLIRYFKRIHSISDWNKWTKKWSKTFILYCFHAAKAKKPVIQNHWLTKTGYGSPEKAKKNYFARSILFRNHFVVLWFLWHEGTMGDFIQGNKYVNYSEWFFFEFPLFMCEFSSFIEI